MSDTRRQFDAMTAKARKRADALVRGLAVEADRRLREKTPVDTGYARGNWNHAVGSPDDTVAPRFASSGPASPRGVEGKAGEVIYLTNAVPYIGALENGHSKQAPSGMVRVTAAELTPLAEQIAVQLQALV